VAQARQTDCEADAVVRSGRPADEIPATATEVGADLIVLGTHGRTGLSQALLGSVALEVLREARQPVLTVGPDAALEGPELDDVLPRRTGGPAHAPRPNTQSRSPTAPTLGCTRCTPST